MLLFNVCYVSAHKSNEKDAFFQASIGKVVKDHAGLKMKKGHIRRWSYEVGFNKFSQNASRSQYMRIIYDSNEYSKGQSMVNKNS